MLYFLGDIVFNVFLSTLYTFFLIILFLMLHKLKIAPTLVTKRVSVSTSLLGNQLGTLHILLTLTDLIYLNKIN